MADLVKKEPSSSIVLNKGKLTSSGTPFQQRVKESKRAIQDLPNRLVLMLDCSGSMSGEPLSLLKDAVDNFVNRCNFNDTAIALRSFPKGASLDLTNVSVIITSTAKQLSSGGGTPMRECIVACAELPITRGIIVSDGDATDWRTVANDAEDHGGVDDELILKPYIDKKTPIDCVHIGASTSGEARLRKIAELTGGLYLKFTDVSAFSNAFGYLTPSYRAMLVEGTLDTRELGAKEIR